MRIRVLQKIGEKTEELVGRESYIYIYTVVGHRDNKNTNIRMLTRLFNLYIHSSNLEYFIRISNLKCKI